MIGAVTAFRLYARAHNQQLVRLACEIADGTFNPAANAML
jgi:hypothetical protein